MTKLLLSISLLTVLTGCTAHSFLEPLGENKKAARVAFGGPIVAAFDTHVPVPYLVAGGAIGVTNRINLNGDLHILPLFYKIAGAEAGAMWFPLSQSGAIPTVGLGGRLLTMGSFRPGVTDRYRAYPIVSITGSWRRNSIGWYVGSDLTLPFTETDYDDESSRAILSPFSGVKWKINERYTLGFELKWQGANLPNHQNAVEYTGIGDHGALAPLFTLERYR